MKTYDFILNSAFILLHYPMNLFQLVLKQMRQRALGTWLTVFSVLLGVAMAVSILIIHREAQNIFVQKDFGYDILLGPSKGSPLQLTLNTVYHMDQSPGVIPFNLYQDLTRKTAPLPGRADYRQVVRQAVPFMVGDSFRNRRIVGTSPAMFGFDDAGKPMAVPWQYREGKSYQIAQGRVFGAKKFEAVVGAEMAQSLNLNLYDESRSPEDNEAAGGAFRATHGMPPPGATPDIHKPIWKIVGILAPTHTANDRVVFVPFISLYAIAEHEDGMIQQALARANIKPEDVKPEQLDDVLRSLGIDPKHVPESMKRRFKIEQDSTAHDHGHDHAHGEDCEHPDVYRLDDKGDIVPDLPSDEWALSAILVKTYGPFQQATMQYNFKVIDERAAAVNPADVMREFFNTFLKGSATVLLIISVLVIVVAAVGILVSIYNSVTARKKEIAILRALGATRNRVLALICIEAAFVGLFGGLLGLLVGHGLAAIGSGFLNSLLGQSIDWLFVDRYELLYLLGVTVLATLAGLVPALSAYKTPVATNLVAA